jgi:hypothetical protein
MSRASSQVLSQNVAGRLSISDEAIIFHHFPADFAHFGRCHARLHKHQLRVDGLYLTQMFKLRQCQGMPRLCHPCPSSAPLQLNATFSGHVTSQEVLGSNPSTGNLYYLHLGSFQYHGL